MPHERARSTTPILDCIEVAGSPYESRSDTDHSSDEYQEAELGSDSDDSLDQRDNALLDSLDSASTTRARFQLSPDKSASNDIKAPCLQPKATPICATRGSDSKPNTMQPESKPRPGGPMKRDRPRSSSASESPRKKRKSTMSFKKDSMRLGSPVAYVSLPPVISTKVDIKGETSKPSPLRSDITIRTTRIKPSPLLPSDSTTKAGIKPDPHPIPRVHSDLLPPSTNKRTKHNPIFDLTGDASHEVENEDQNSPANLQKKNAELSSELGEYRRNLAEANKEVQRLKSDELMRKAREHDELEKRTKATADMERELRFVKRRNDQLAKDKVSLNDRFKAKEARASELQKTSDEQVERYEADTKRLRSSKKQTKKRLEAEVAKIQALTTAKDELEERAVEQAKEHEVTVSRLQTEVAEVKEELEDQKHATDWYKAKFLKFKAGYHELDEERKEKAEILRRMVPAICSVAGMSFDQTKSVEESDAVADQVGADNDSPADHTLGGSLAPAREDELTTERQMGKM